MAEPLGRARAWGNFKSKIQNPKFKITRASRAFTLVEVLVSLTIFALSAIVLGATYVNVLNSYSIASRTNATNEDVAFARSLVTQQPDNKKLVDGGEFDSATPGRHVKWTADIAPTTTADLFTVVFTCEVSDPGAATPDRTVETFTLLRPTWTIEGSDRSQLKQDAKNRIYEIQGKTPGSGPTAGSGAATKKPKK